MHVRVTWWLSQLPPSLPLQEMLREVGGPAASGTVTVSKDDRKKYSKDWKTLAQSIMSCAEQTLELLLVTIGAFDSRMFAMSMADDAGWTSFHFLAR